MECDRLCICLCLLKNGYPLFLKLTDFSQTFPLPLQIQVYHHTIVRTKFNESKVNRPNVKINPNPSLYLSIAIFYKLDIAPTTLGSEMYNHEQIQKAVHKNIWMPNECL